MSLIAFAVLHGKNVPPCPRWVKWLCNAIIFGCVALVVYVEVAA